MPSLLEVAEDIDFITKTAIERDPKKRRVKPVETQASILDFDLGESSDDSDFRIEDHAEVSDDDSIDSNGEGKGSESSEDEEEDSESDLEDLKNLSLPSDGLSVADLILQATQQSNKNLQFNEKDAQIMICCGCLGDQSDGVNEIVECDNCGVTVHEACYGISDSASLASTDSLSPTAPWFCEACKAGVTNPVCELCPNSGGIFKETDVGKWVHLVCALYVPGVAFGEVDRLSSVTLFEMPYSKWGAKSCSLCQDERFARTGVCIGCDAGMCRTYFHVTCAQREGYLSEAHSEEVDQADPFYAHCKLHSDKTLVKKRKRNYLALQLRNHYRRIQFQQPDFTSSSEQKRIKRKLEKYQVHYFNSKGLKTEPWVPTQKMPRLLTTSASACRKLLHKAELMGVDTIALEMQEAQASALVDVRKKWHIPPAFTVEFIAYYLDRNDRLKGMKKTLEGLLEANSTLLAEQQTLRNKYDELTKQNAEETKKNQAIKQTIHKYHSAILSACPTKNLPNVDNIGKPIAPRPVQPLMVPTAAALKMGVGFPLSSIASGRNDSGRVLSSHAKQEPLLNECGICRQRRDQHLLAKCDTCHLYYHMNCLNPPLSRLPKKSKLYGWQCSECDKTSDSEVEEVKTPRRSRGRYSKDKYEPEVFTPKVKIKPIDPSPNFSNVTVHLTHYDFSDSKSNENDPNISTSNRSESEHMDESDRMDENDHVETGQGIRVRHDLMSHDLMGNNSVSRDCMDGEEDGELMEDVDQMDDERMEGDRAEGVDHTKTGDHIKGSEHKSKSEGKQKAVNNETMLDADGQTVIISSRSGKKRRRDKHKSRYSPDLGSPTKEHKRKRKKKSLDIENPHPPHPRITIKIKPIPMPAGEVASSTNPQCFYVPNENNDNAPPPIIKSPVVKPPVARSPILKSPAKSPAKSPTAVRSPSARASAPSTACKKTSQTIQCDVCRQEGNTTNCVSCDECQKCYHFTCLDPPLKKSPKKRGYSWHCADCDPTGSE